MKKVSQLSLVNRYYDRTRPEYNLFWRSHRNLAMHFGYYEKNIRSHDEAVANLNKKLSQITGISKDDVVLDAGSGLGGSSLWLAENLGCHVTGVNVVKWQNELANHHAVQRNLTDKVKFIIADYADTNLPKESSTIFWGVESIVHAENKEAVLKEAYRLLKPGGKILISEYLLKDEPLSLNEKEIVQPWLDGWAMPHLATEDQYRELFIKTGFRDIEVLDWTSHVNPSLNRLRRFVKLVRPFKKLLRKLDIVNDEQISDYEASRSQMLALDAGIWRYKVIVGRKSK